VRHEDQARQERRPRPLIPGTVKFEPYSRDQKMVSVIPADLPAETVAAAAD
jgi:hypothetical protein